MNAPENVGIAAGHAADTLRYQTGFLNEHMSEALAGALPHGRNLPQHPPHGLYPEQMNATSFTAPRADNLRSWMYRIYPTAAAQAAWERLPMPQLDESGVSAASPSRYRWAPWPVPDAATDFIDGLTRVAHCGGAAHQAGMSLYAYGVNRPMQRVFCDFDGELLLLPQVGTLRLVTEMGRLDVGPGEIALLPRAMRVRVELRDAQSRGFVCENLGNHFRLPERGVVGANGLANERDFLIPHAAYEIDDRPVELVGKYAGQTWRSELKRSPFDVVAWHGRWAPCKYDMRRFNAMNTVTYDHPDPSLFCALSSPSGQPGVANVDFCILPPRWLVADNTFRPPFHHRNAMSEILISLVGTPEARGGHYEVGTSTLHNAFAPHGPDPEVIERASNAVLQPKFEDTLMIMFETRLPFTVSDTALAAPNRAKDYERNWERTPPRFAKPA